jgi:hypothetical protein
LILRGPEAKGLYAVSLWHPVRSSCAAFYSSRRLVKLDEETFVRPLPAENVRAGGESDIGYCDGRLDDEVVRVFAVGRVASSDKNDPGDDFSMRIDDTGGSTHLGFDALLLDWSTQWQHRAKLLGRGGTPDGFYLGSKRRWEEYREQKDERQLHRDSLI